VEMLNGKISVQSEPGKGSNFRVSIPCMSESMEDKAVVLKYTDPKISGENMIVLIAEDDYASYLYLESLLSGPNVTFLHTTNGNDTVKIVQDKPDLSLILMDLRMPGMSGLDATRQIREFNKTVPIIAQTAYALAGDREMALKAGCNDYISKPVNPAELHKVISHYTEK
jgi:CheY-like chemotaxis protein